MGTHVNVDNFVAAETARMFDTPSLLVPSRIVLITTRPRHPERAGRQDDTFRETPWKRLGFERATKGA